MLTDMGVFGLSSKPKGNSKMSHLNFFIKGTLPESLILDTVNVRFSGKTVRPFLSSKAVVPSKLQTTLRVVENLGGRVFSTIGSAQN